MNNGCTGGGAAADDDDDDSYLKEQEEMKNKLVADFGRLPKSGNIILLSLNFANVKLSCCSWFYVSINEVPMIEWCKTMNCSRMEMTPIHNHTVYFK